MLLSIYNHDSAIASAASRMTWAAGERPCIEMGSRRTHECGGGGLRPGRRTSPGSRPPPTSQARPAVRRADHRHQRALLHPAARHRGATRSAPRSTRWARGTTLLVDTYDIDEAVRLGGRGRRAELGAVRIDSGDLGVLAHRVRAQLDDLGAHDTRIIVTSDLDEFAIAGLGLGPGRRLRRRHRAGHRQRPPDLRLRLQAGRPRGRRRRAGRRGEEEHRQDLDRRPQVRAAPALAPDGVAEAEVIGIGSPPRDDGDDRALLVPLVRDGEVVGREPLDDARERHLRSRAELPLVARQLSQGEPGDSRPCTREPRAR